MPALIIHSFDQGRRMGYAYGPAGEVPVRTGAFFIREEKEPKCVSWGNLIDFLDKLWRRETPDILILEEPQSIAQWFQTNRGKPRPTSPAGVESGLELTAIIIGMAERYGIKRVEAARRQSVLKHITGKHNHSSAVGAGDGRQRGKIAIIEAMKELGAVSFDCKDEDMCDAIAMHIYASDKFAGTPQKNFKLTPG